MSAAVFSVWSREEIEEIRRKDYKRYYYPTLDKV